MASGELNLLDELGLRYQEIQDTRDLYDKLVWDMLEYCRKFEAAYRYQNEKLATDLQRARKDYKILQSQLDGVESCSDWVAKESGESRARNPYALAVIDGNARIFLDAWMKQGTQGGSLAAEILHAAMAHKLAHLPPNTTFMAKVVVNLSSLAKTLGRDLSDLKSFAQGFTRIMPHFEFIDVGYGDNAALSKIKNIVAWHIKNIDCRQLLLGVANDAAYADFLQQQPARLSLIEGIPTSAALVATGVPRISLPELFREDTPPPIWPLSSWTDDRSASPSTCTSNSSVFSSPPRKSSVVTYADAISTSPTPAPVDTPPKISLPFPLPLPPKPIARPKIQYVTIPPVQPDWNPGRRGLDEPITVAASALERIKRRKDNDKLCNNHYLRGPCAKLDNCSFEHDYKATGEEKHAIAVLARQNPCTAGQYCDTDDCIYGHHCPSIKDGACVHPFCRYSDDAHPPGTKFRTASLKLA